MTTSWAKRLLFVDIETYSEVDLSSCGVYRYSDDPSFEVMLFSYAYDDEPVEVVDIAQGEEIPEIVLLNLTNSAITKVAHNANFERVCLTRWLGRPMLPQQWVCTAVRASMLGLPRSLANVGEVLGLREDDKKLSSGKRLVQYFAKPCAPTKTNGGRRRNLPSHEPEKWEQYKEYNRQDVVTERAIYKLMNDYPKMTDTEKRLWQLDQCINDEGILIDVTLAKHILRYSKKHKEELEQRAIDLSGIANPSSLQQIRVWLSGRGINPDSLDKESVKGLINKIVDPDAVEFLKIRLELGKTSVTKYAALARAMCSDRRLRGTLQFYGASHTGRWAGRVFQPQNLPQNKMKDLDLARNIVRKGDFELLEIMYDSPMDVFSQLVRTALITDEGNTFAVADYSAIEARVVAWLAHEEWALKEFRGAGKIYEATAAQMYGVPLEEVTKGSELRKKGKIATLACGYGGGVGALSKMDRNGDIPEHEKQAVINAWRSANPHIVRLWGQAEKAAKDAITHPGVAIKLCRGIVFKMIGSALFIKLPSGRALAYQNARVDRCAFGTTVKYKGQNQTTKKWEDITTYGGRIVENLVQATARDCLGAAMLALADVGYKIRTHIHDEVVVEVAARSAEEDLMQIREIMTLKDVVWAKDLPLTADGYLTPYYKKD